ncbi:MAG: hypothetical protein OHK0056_26730 [Bacteriovoracaceae bacterium]
MKDKSNKNKQNKSSLMIFVFSVSFFVIFVLMKNEKTQQVISELSFFSTADPNDNQAIETEEHNKNLEIKEYFPPVSEGKVEIAKKIPSSKAQESEVEKFQKEQELIKIDFQRKIMAKINLPGHMKYNVLDLEEGVEGIHGISPRGEEELSVLAAAKSVKVEEVVDYLEKSTSAFPQLRNGDFNKNSPTFKIAPPPGKGISNITIINGKKYGNQEVYAALVERSDKKGTYLFVMKASSKFFNENEGFLDKMLADFEAK